MIKVVDFEDEYTCVIESDEELNFENLLQVYIPPTNVVDSHGNQKELSLVSKRPLLRIVSKMGNIYVCVGKNGEQLTDDIAARYEELPLPNIAINDWVREVPNN